MGEMKFLPTPIPDLYEIRTAPFTDARGRFTRLFCEQEFECMRSNLHFPQINLSASHMRGTVRGLHYQTPPAAEAKLVRCLRGRVFDVAVDLRAGSSTFLSWHALELSDDNALAVYIPEGFAHGFQTLTDDVQVLYMHTASWTPMFEAGLRHDDARLSIRWPLPVTALSDRDCSYAPIDDAFAGIRT